MRILLFKESWEVLKCRDDYMSLRARRAKQSQLTCKQELDCESRLPRRRFAAPRNDI